MNCLCSLYVLYCLCENCQFLPLNCLVKLIKKKCALHFCMRLGYCAQGSAHTDWAAYYWLCSLHVLHWAVVLPSIALQFFIIVLLNTGTCTCSFVMAMKLNGSRHHASCNTQWFGCLLLLKPLILTGQAYHAQCFNTQWFGCLLWISPLY